MASLQQRASGRFRIIFCFSGERHFVSLKTRSPKEAETTRIRVEENLRDLERGRLSLPPGADLGLFLLSDGRLTQAPTIEKTFTLNELFDAYEKDFPKGAKEENTRSTERIHLKHFRRILGGDTPLPTIGTALMQKYVSSRTNEAGRGGRPLSHQTIKKEIGTLASVWNRFAVPRGFVKEPAPTKGLVYRKGKGRPPFQSKTQIERQIARGGNEPTPEHAELKPTQLAPPPLPISSPTQLSDDSHQKAPASKPLHDAPREFNGPKITQQHVPLVQTPLSARNDGPVLPSQSTIAWQTPCRDMRVWLRGEYLHWWIRDAGAPPLVTTNPAGTAFVDAGFLGGRNTQVLLGGNRTSVIDSFGGTEASTYDNANYLTSRSYQGQGVTLGVSFTNNKEGWNTALTRSITEVVGTVTTTTTASTTDTDYDNAGRITKIYSHKGSTLLNQFDYAFGADGNLSAKTDVQNASCANILTQASPRKNCGESVPNQIVGTGKGHQINDLSILEPRQNPYR